MRQLRDGVAGGLCAVLPLLAVNAMGYLGLLDTQEALLAGALALVGGPLLGGVVAGLLGSRTRRAIGAIEPLRAGIVAGILYLATLLALVIVAAQIGAEPPILAEHPLRVGGAMICLATLLAAVALGIGALASRHSRGPLRAARTAPQPAARTLARMPAMSAARRAAAPASDGRARAARQSGTPSSDARR